VRALPGSGMRRRGWGAHCSTHPNRQRRIRPVPQLRGQPAPEACTEQEPPLPCSLARTVDRAACYPGRPARIQETNRNEHPKHRLRRPRHGKGFLAAGPSRWPRSSFPAAPKTCASRSVTSEAHSSPSGCPARPPEGGNHPFCGSPERSHPGLCRPVRGFASRAPAGREARGAGGKCALTRRAGLLGKGWDAVQPRECGCVRDCADEGRLPGIFPRAKGSGRSSVLARLSAPKRGPGSCPGAADRCPGSGELGRVQETKSHAWRTFSRPVPLPRSIVWGRRTLDDWSAS